MTKKIKVLHVYKRSFHDSKGGVEVFINTLANTTSDFDVENTVLSLHESPSRFPINLGKYRVIQAKQNIFFASTGFSISAFFIFNKLAKEVDIIHYHFPNPFADMLHFICRIDKPTILTYHSDIIKQRLMLHFYRPMKLLFMKSVGHIVATSPNYFATSDLLQKFSEKVSVIPIGIDTKFYPKPSDERLKYWSERFDEPFFFFVGAMRYYKGLHIALNAIKNTELQLVIAGINGIEKELKSHASSQNISNVSFVGQISEEDKVCLLRLCKGFVFPSHLRSEAFGIALLEAAAFGKPLISCEIGTGTTFINKSDKTGIVVNPGSSAELRQAMRYLLQNPVLANEMGQNAKKRALELFTAEKQALSYINLYKKLVTK